MGYLLTIKMAVVTRVGGGKLLHRLLKKLTAIHRRFGSGDGYSKTIIRNQEHKPVRGSFPIYVEYEGYDVPLEFLYSKRFLEFLEQYEDEIHAKPNEPITLPCSKQDFEAEFNLVKAEKKIAVRPSVR